MRLYIPDASRARSGSFFFLTQREVVVSHNESNVCLESMQRNFALRRRRVSVSLASTISSYVAVNLTRANIMLKCSICYGDK